MYRVLGCVPAPWLALLRAHMPQGATGGAFEPAPGRSRCPRATAVASPPPTRRRADSGRRANGGLGRCCCQALYDIHVDRRASCARYHWRPSASSAWAGRTKWVNRPGRPASIQAPPCRVADHRQEQRAGVGTAAFARQRAGDRLRLAGLPSDRSDRLRPVPSTPPAGTPAKCPSRRSEMAWIIPPRPNHASRPMLVDPCSSCSTPHPPGPSRRGYSLVAPALW